MRLISIVGLSILCLVNLSCGTSDSESAQGSVDVKSLAGKYNWVTSSIDFSCSDFTSGNIEGFAKVLEIQIDNSQITIIDNSSDSAEKAAAGGISVQNTTKLSGVIEKDGSFKATQVSNSNHNEFGPMSTNYSIEGIFTADSWSGNYVYDIYFSKLSVVCKYKSTFQGSKQT